MGLVMHCVQGGLMDKVFLVKIKQWGKLLQFSWVSCYIVTVINIWGVSMKCYQTTLFIKFYSERHHISTFKFYTAKRFKKWFLS